MDILRNSRRIEIIEMTSQVQTSESSLFNLFDIFLDPATAARRLNTTISWLYPLLIVGLGGIAIGFASISITRAVIEQGLPAGLPDDQAQQVVESFFKYHNIGIMLTPLLLLVKWSLSAWILWMSCVIAEIRVGYKNLFALLAQCSLLVFLQDLAVYTILRLGSDRVQTAADLAPRLGFDIFITGLSKPVMAGLGYFSFFNLWYIVILTLALSYLGRVSKGRAFLATIPVWFLPMCLTVGIAWLG